MPWADSNIIPWGPRDIHLETKTRALVLTPSNHYPSSSSSTATTTITTTIPSESTPTGPSPLPKNQPRRLTLLTLPLEIRLQIYQHVHASHAVSPPQLAPWLPNPAYSAYVLRPVLPDFLVRTLQDPYPAESSTIAGTDTGTTTRTDDTNVSSPALLSARRPVCRVPSTLLRASRQVYDEARLIPFTQNEFVFVSAFCSGVAAARAFSTGLRPWQRDALRYARVEMRESDLSTSTGGEWARLCSLWAIGLRGLRLRIVFAKSSSSSRDGDEKERNDGKEEETARRERNCRALGAGLRMMRSLRQVEVDLAQDGWTDEEKVQWCRALADVVNPEGMPQAGGGRVRVVCVERTTDKPESKEVCRPGKTA